MTDKTARRKASSLARAFDIGIEWERSTEVWWVTGPADIYVHNGHNKFPVASRDDPLEGQHTCIDVFELLYSVQTYVWDIACHLAGVSEEQAANVWRLTTMDSRWNRGIDPAILVDVALRADPVEIAQTIDMATDGDSRLVRQ